MLEKLLKKTIDEQVKRAFDVGVQQGFSNGFRMGRLYQRSLDENTGVILSSRVRQDLEEIIKGKEF